MIARVRQARLNTEGFTLIEIVVAMGIATVIFSAMAAAGLAGVRASVVARQNQQAVDVLNKIVEQDRSLSFTSVAMVTSDLQVNDTAVSNGASPKYTVPNGIGLESVWAKTTGAISPHVATTTQNGFTYTTRSYVTTPVGFTLDSAGQPNQKRLTVVITWSSYGQSHQRVISTLLTETTRGLALPRYGVTATSPTTQTKTPSTTLTWGFQVRNRGARDTFNVSASAGTWTYYVDTDCDGSRDIGEDTALSNTDAALGDSRPDTGKLEPNNYPPFCITAQRSIPSTETGTSSVTFNFQSSAQPTASGAAVAVGPFTVSVTNGSTGGSASPTPSGSSAGPSTVCTPTPAGVGTPFGFRNGTSAISGSSTSTLINSMTENTCLNQPASANYSTEVGAGTGRSLTTGGSATSSSQSTMAEWRWNPSSTRTVQTGTATISVMVSCPVVGASVTLNGAVGTFNEKSPGTWTSRGTGIATVGCTTANSWVRVTVPMSVSTAFTVANKVQGSPQDLSARLWVTGGTASEKIRLDYEQVSAKSFLYLSLV